MQKLGMHTYKEETNMKSTIRSFLTGVALAATALLYTLPASAQESSFGPADAKEIYYWISNKANLPLFVQYDYVGMKRIAEELGVKVIVAGPTDFDMPASSPRSTRSARRSRRRHRSAVAGIRR